MKRLIPILLCLALAAGLFACGKEVPEAPVTQVVNPIQEVSDSDAFLELDIFLCAPEEAENCRYSIISGEIAQIQYTWSEIEFTLRAGNTDEDISGVYAEWILCDCGVLLPHESGEYLIRTDYTTDGAGLSKWFIDETQYTLYASAPPDFFEMYATGVAKEHLKILYPVYGYEDPLTVTSGGKTFVPYTESVYSMTWWKKGFLCADGGIDLPNLWGSTGLFPEIVLQEDLQLHPGVDARLRTIRVYDQELNLLTESFESTACFYDLEPGRYCVEAEVCQDGPIVEDEQLYTGYACVFSLIVP